MISQQNRVAIFPGSFDPFTVGHEVIVRRALTLFDIVVVGIGINTKKSGFLSVENRRCLIEDTFAKEPRVRVKTYEGLTVEFCKANYATHIIRGLRNSEDMEFERAIEILNRNIDRKIETIYLLTAPEHLHISSSAVRELHTFGEDTSSLLPHKIKLDNYL